MAQRLRVGLPSLFIFRQTTHLSVIICSKATKATNKINGVTYQYGLAVILRSYCNTSYAATKDVAALGWTGGYYGGH